MKDNINKKSTLQRFKVVLFVSICLFFIIASIQLLTKENAMQSIERLYIVFIALLSSLFMTLLTFRLIFLSTNKTAKFIKIIQFLVLTIFIAFMGIFFILNPPPNFVKYSLFFIGLILSISAIIYFFWMFIIRKSKNYNDRLGNELLAYNWSYIGLIILFCFFVIELIDETTLNAIGIFIAGHIIGIIIGITGGISNYIIVRSKRIGGLMLIILLISPFIELIIFLNILKNYFQ